MSDGTVMSVIPPEPVREKLLTCGAMWYGLDIEGHQKYTTPKPRGRNVPTPLTGAKFRIDCFPRGKKYESQELSYELSFHPPACLIGNNIFPENLVRVPAVAALASWKHYMRTRFSGVTNELLDLVTLKDCRLNKVTFVYLWKCDSPDAAKTLHARIYRHLKTCLDGSTRYRPRNADLQSMPRRKNRVRTDANEGETFYADTDFGQVRVYIKTPNSPNTFCNVAAPEALDMLYEESKKVVRFEIELDVKKFRYGKDNDQYFSSDLVSWTTEKMPDDPAEIVWSVLRKVFSFDDSLAKHEPQEERISKLPLSYQNVLRAHLRGNIDLFSIVGENKQYNRIAKKLMSDFKITIYLPWMAQKRGTWSSWLAERLQYSKRLNPSELGALGEHCLTRENVWALTNELQVKAFQS